MAKYRNRLPQIGNKLFLTDGGMETTLIFEQGLDLPFFAAFDLLKNEEGKRILENYFRKYASVALRSGTGFVLESPTWRANTDWGNKLGYNQGQLAQANRSAIQMLEELRNELETLATPMVISGCVGPRGDGYAPGDLMGIEQAKIYHLQQISVFADAGADMITAITMTNTPEAIGVVLAAAEADIPVAISLTVETDGTLPTGQPLREAISEIDSSTRDTAAYFMINCAHPTHFDGVLETQNWVKRIRGLRANASRCSHAELDEAETLDSGNAVELGTQYASLKKRFPNFNVLGGCCGTNHRHIEEIAKSCVSLPQEGVMC